jgi:hypothetical protein
MRKISPPHLALAAALSAAAALFFVLYRFPPDRYSFYPRCPIYALTGWQCPGCGMTRAVAALLHGRLFEALHWNPLAPVILVLLAWFFCVPKPASHTGSRMSPRQLAVALAALAAFTVMRNL